MSLPRSSSSDSFDDSESQAFQVANSSSEMSSLGGDNNDGAESAADYTQMADPFGASSSSSSASSASRATDRMPKRYYPPMVSTFSYEAKSPVSGGSPQNLTSSSAATIVDMPTNGAGSAAAVATTTAGNGAGAGTGTGVSADSIDLDLLDEDSAFHQGPLLTEYKSTTSRIRQDYSTVDWFFTKHQLLRLRKLIRTTNNAQGTKGKLMNAFIAAQGWIILLFVGLFTAVSASFIHIVGEWLIDVKEGYCVGHSFFNARRICCADATTANPCGWRTWDQIMNVGSNSGKGSYWFNYFIYLIWAIPCAVLASYLVKVYARSAARSGISEMKVMLGGFVIKRFLGIRTLLIKSLGVILSVSSGLHVGKLGPLMHIACCWGNIFARPFQKYNLNEVKKREIFSASVAAGVSAAFGSPIGGVLFSLESISSYFPPQTMWRSFWSSITAALVLQWIDPFQTGKLVQFAVTSNPNEWQSAELILFALIGVCGGCAGAAFIRLNTRVNTYRKVSAYWRTRPVLDVLILIVITAIINFPIIYLRGSSSALLGQLFTNCQSVSTSQGFDTSSADPVNAALCPPRSGPNGTYTSSERSDINHSIGVLFAALLVKFVLTSVTYGCNVPGGVFMPAMVIGAMFGRLIGWAMYLQHNSVGNTGFFSVCSEKTDCVAPGLYAIVGAAAMLTGVTRLTVSLTVIIFEVTGGLDYIVPIMLAIVCSKWVADAFGRQGLYPMRIAMFGYPWIDAHAEMELNGPASDIMSRDMVTFNVYGETIQSIRRTLQQHPYHGFPVVDGSPNRLAFGYVARSDLETMLEQNKDFEAEHPLMPVHFTHEPPPQHTPNFLDFSNIVDKHPIKVLPHTSLDRVLVMFQSLGLRTVLVLSHRGSLVGLIKKKDMLLYIRSHKEADMSTV